MTLVDRDTGRARSTVIRDLSHGEIWSVVSKNVAREARLMTDEAGHYRFTGMQFATHETVNHGQEEYARGDVTTNTVEGYFSIFKKGMKGFISIAMNATCIAIWRNSTSAITTVKRLAWTT